MAGLSNLFRILVLGATLLAPGAAHAAMSYFEDFPVPLYLVEISREQGTGAIEYRLVPVEQRRTAPDGMQARVIGGPYQKRMEVELDRNRLAQDGHPVNLVPISVRDGSGNRTNDFLLGAKPILVAPDGKELTGEVDASFAPQGPAYFPVPFSFDDFEKHYNELKEEQERLRGDNDGEGPVISFGGESTTTDAMAALPAISASANVTAHVTCPGDLAAIFGGARAGATWSFSNTVAVGFERKEDGAVNLTIQGDQSYVIPGTSDDDGNFEASLTVDGNTLIVTGVMDRTVAEQPDGVVASGNAKALVMGDTCTAEWSTPGAG